jgi:heat shock protein HslJ
MVFILSCSAGDKQGEKHVYWVNSSMASCVGMAPSRCLQVQKSEILDPDAWESFHASIKGFKYEAGYIYKIVVKERHLDPADLPADASSIEYTLVEILEKTQDLKFRIQDVWQLSQIMESTGLADVKSSSLPQLEINVGEMSYHGTDGCNRFSGGIAQLDDRSIRFGISAGTRMMCQDMKVPDLFNATLPQVSSWEINENVLYLFNTSNEKLMQLKRAD